MRRWCRPFRNLDPLAEPIFRLRRRFPQSEFSTICSLKSPGTCKYFLSSDTFIALKSVLILFTLRATFFASILAEIKKINFRYGQASRQWKLSTTKCQSPYAESWLVEPMSELLLFVYNKSHVTLHVKSNAEKVNSPTYLRSLIKLSHNYPFTRISHTHPCKSVT